MTPHIPTNARPPGVRCSLAASCPRGMLLAVEDAGATIWEVVRFHTYGHELVATFQHGPDARACYNRNIKPNGDKP